MKGSGPASEIGNIEPEPELRTWPMTRRNLHAAACWWAWSIVSAYLAIGCAGVVSEVTTGSTPLGRVIVFAIPLVLLGGVFALALIIVGALGCLPLFLLVPWLVRRVPWFDRSRSGAALLCLLLAIPAPVTLGAVWGFGAIELRDAALVCGSAVVGIAIPRLVFRSLRVGTLSAGF